MRKSEIAFIILIICLPLSAIGLIFKGVEQNNVAQIVGGACLLIFIIIAYVGAYIWSKKPKEKLTPEEQRQRNLAFIKKHSKVFLVLSIVSAILSVTSMILLIVFVNYDAALMILTICMISFGLTFIAFFCSYMGAKNRNKKDKNRSMKKKDNAFVSKNTQSVSNDKFETLQDTTALEDETVIEEVFDKINPNL